MDQRKRKGAKTKYTMGRAQSQDKNKNVRNRKTKIKPFIKNPVDKDKEESGSDDENLETRKMVSAQNRKKKKSGGFQSMGLSYGIYKGITKKGYKVPTPIQRKTVPLILDGKDVVAMARTGSGKTAAFLIPMFERLQTHSSQGARALILSPTRELAMQTMKFTRELGKFTKLKATCILGGDRLEDQFAAMHENPDVIIATPGRFLHLIVEMESKLNTIEYVVFDEADRLFEMGFAEQLQEIIRRLPDSRQTLLFSATLPKLLVEFAKAGLNDPVLIRLDVDKKISEQLKMSFFSVRVDEKAALLLYILQNSIKSTEQTVVFVATKHHVEYIRELLGEAGMSCSFIYSSLDQTARKINVAKFQKKKTVILVVTDVAARGIDIPMLDNVINYDFPAKPKLFVHRVGRVARAGRTGTAYSMISNDEVPFLIDLHLFLGRPVKIAQAETSKDEDDIFGAVPRTCLDENVEFLTRIHDTTHDLASLKQVMENACKQYLKSRPLPSSESVKRGKDLISSAMSIHPFLAESSDSSARSQLLDDLKTFKPSQTIFEVRGTKKSADSAAVMKSKRNCHGFIIEKNKLRKAENAFVTDLKRNNVLTESQDFVIEQFGLSSDKEKGYKDVNYIPHKSTDFHAEQGLSVGTFQRDAEGATVEMVADEKDQMRKQTGMKKWDRKRKNFVTQDPNKGVKRLKTESGAWIRASYKKNIYKDWVQKNRLDTGLRNQEETNEEDQLQGKGRNKKAKKQKRGSRSELKSKDQIVKSRMKKQNMQARLKSTQQRKGQSKNKGRPGQKNR